MATTIKMSAIAMPPHYIRGQTEEQTFKINGKNIKDLLDIVCKHNGVDAEKWETLKGKKLEWPFSSVVEVAKNPAPEKGKKLKATEEGKGKKKVKVFRAYELMDGIHRVTLWRRLKQKEIPATIKDITNPAERFMEQYRTNASHGLRLDKDARDNAVRIAHNIYKLSLTFLSKETGLDRSSIARIVAMKQRKEGPRKKADKKEFSATDGSLPAGEMSVQGFIERMQLLANAFPKLASEIDVYVRDNFVTTKKAVLGTFIARIRDIATAFEKPLLAHKTNGKDKQSTTPEQKGV